MELEQVSKEKEKVHRGIKRHIKRADSDMTGGSIWRLLITFALPLAAGLLFQQLYNTVDAIVVGKFVGTDALAAVGGSASNILNLLIGFFTGVSSGATVIISQYFGANDRDGVNRALHTAMLFALVGGAFIMVLGLVGTEFMLRLMDTPEDTIAGSALYLRIMFMGMVPNMVYNVGSAILRAMGDSKRPLYFLIVACLSNVVLDLVFVLVFKMGIAGVAIASILAQAISAVMVVMSLSAESMEYRFRFRQMRFEGDILSRTIRIGLPAGFQSIMYSLSNMLIQASVNRFGTDTVASWVVLGKVDGINWMILGALGIASMTFVGQNYGAGKRKRIIHSYFISMVFSFGIALVMSALLVIFGRQFLALFTTEGAVIDAGMKRVGVMGFAYCISAFMDCTIAASRGLGKTVVPTVIVIMGSCVFRVIWVYTIFAHFHTIPSLYLLYPCSWALTAIAEILYFIHCYKQAMKIFREPIPSSL